jgi:pimeloyl-ACP methyl ester carboxylesterase
MNPAYRSDHSARHVRTFSNNYIRSLAVMSALNRGGPISEIDEACRPLKEHAGKKALGGDPSAQQAWFESSMKVAERVERLGRVDEDTGHALSAGRKYPRAELYYLLAERMPSHKDPRRLDAYRLGIDVYKRGLIARKEPVEFVAVPFGAHKLPAYFSKAPVAWAAIFDYCDTVAERIGGKGEPSVPGYAEHVNWVFGKNTIEETLAVVKQPTLEHVAEKITGPLLIVHGENDRQVPLWHAEKTFERAVNSPGRKLVVCRLADGGAEHCGADNGPLVVDLMADWVAEQLGGAVNGV